MKGNYYFDIFPVLADERLLLREITDNKSSQAILLRLGFKQVPYIGDDFKTSIFINNPSVGQIKIRRFLVIFNTF